MLKYFRARLFLLLWPAFCANYAKSNALTRIYSPTGTNVSCSSGFEFAPNALPSSGLVDEAFLQAAIRRISAVYIEYSGTADRPFGVSTFASIAIDIVKRIKKETDPQLRLRYATLLFPQVVLAVYTDYASLLIGSSDPGYVLIDAFMDMLEQALAHATVLLSDKGMRLIDWVERLKLGSDEG